MNILYYSVHQILEDDEVRLFQDLGHNVFCLGANGRDGQVQTFRPPINFSAQEQWLYDQFEQAGGRFVFGRLDETVIPAEFCELIDIFIVMHDPDFIKRFWSRMTPKPVVWRTIGQGVADLEDAMRAYRHHGLLIVRYSPVENEVANTLGADAVIRFFKDGKTYSDWTGARETILTFSNLFKQRYADDFTDYSDIVSGMPSLLGGIGNDDVENAIGMVSFEEQIALLKDCKAYLYASGLYIPYTLNFMEAWMTGIPIVVHAPIDRKTPFFEIDRLITDGYDGFVCRSPQQARECLGALLTDRHLAERIGTAGRRRALDIFGRENARGCWSEFLSHAQSSETVDIIATPHHAGIIQVKNMSEDVFNTLSLLRPYDIDVPKMRIGNPRDGGYVLADLPSVSDIMSFGVGPDISFEYEMALKGRRAYLHDHTVSELPQKHPRLTFVKRGICATGAETSELSSLETHLHDANLSENTPLLLKIDVEGWEWDVFSTVAMTTLERFEQIAVEVHWLENISNADFRAKVVTSLTKINKLFTLFHVHANNCAEIHLVEGFPVASVLELAFVRTDLVKRSTSRSLYPSALDKANHPSFHDHPLLFYPFLPSIMPEEDIRATIRRIELEKRFSAN